MFIFIACQASACRKRLGNTGCQNMKQTCFACPNGCPGEIIPTLSNQPYQHVEVWQGEGWQPLDRSQSAEILQRRDAGSMRFAISIDGTTYDFNLDPWWQAACRGYEMCEEICGIGTLSASRISQGVLDTAWNHVHCNPQGVLIRLSHANRKMFEGTNLLYQSFIWILKCVL